MAPLILPEPFKDGAHIKLICTELERLEQGKLLRFMLSLPPGSMKSVLVNKLFVAWCIGRNPQWQILSVSHKTELAMGFGRDVRDLMSHPEYQAIFPGVRIRDDVSAAGRWITTHKGRYVAAGAGSNIAGMRANLGILDDILSEQTASSDVERQRVLDWYAPGFRTRLLPSARIVSVQTRWHHNDVNGWLLENMKKSKNPEPWEVLSVPAIIKLDSEEAILLGKYEKGNSSEESFWPEMWPLRELLRVRDGQEMTPAKWNALYMQNPTPEEGALFKRTYFKVWSQPSPPECTNVILSLDTAYSVKTQADFTVLQAWGIFETTRTDSDGIEYIVKNMLLLAQKKDRFEYPELKQVTLDYYKKFHPDAVVVEKKASGQTLLQDLWRAGIPCVPYTPDRDKLSRANAIIPIMLGGRVWIPERDWAEDLVNECLQFPLGQHDDCVDALTQAVIWLRDSFKVGVPMEDQGVLPDRPAQKRRTYWSDRKEINV